MDNEWSEEGPRKGFGPQKGKSPRKYTFTYEDISEITRLTVPTIRAYVHLKKFDPTNFASVIKFVVPYLGLKEVS